MCVRRIRLFRNGWNVLWLDGGQVAPQNGEDIRLSEAVKEARKLQPWLLTADRTVGGENENYITPEQSVSASPIRVPWESCVTVGHAFSYRFEEQYKTPRQLVHLLIDVVCRGGNLALNIAPQPNGMLPAQAVRAVNGLRAWLRANGEAIYGTRMAEPNENGQIVFTRKGHTVYALMRLAENERLGESLFIPWPEPVRSVTMLDVNAPGSFEQENGGVRIQIPYGLIGSQPLAPAFRME